MGSEAQQTELDSTLVFHQLDSYPWSEDEEFQGGLRAILGSVQDPQQVGHLTLRAKCYYYARKAGTSVDFDGYKRWVEQQNHEGETNGAEDGWSILDSEPPAQADSSGGMADAPKPASFADICDMIAEGKPIPGIKDIPDTILEGQASESKSDERKKPWEKAASSADDKPSWMK
ncbi:hypothetical protein CLAFUW4_02666 [Fulvia fulva]|uniref:Uncharacterized protein n=1 Tax=Passalora fulva TaxID=5499 RepID=A0A9Q8P5X8_PASFU|nr:uncharacterized protein CLAFUR5_02656 [Fulvia fulva]KAK4632137.1 hypothetical protein CLAFUR4_02661 [Fulvia fulva]UJO14414.1 hypothetical protein CLAFUR5_02656 [Fulvia fulva]WPV10865.1 hypothetical protein CLAFUW4_02666 [Fulvia fulva]WPV25391.1 hypothetical protein CLAFUW7_02665 [Fulvia fulva]